MNPISANFYRYSNSNSCQTIEELNVSEPSFNNQSDGDVKLDTDDMNMEIEISKSVVGEELRGCLLLVHVPNKGEHYAAWHVAGADLYLYSFTPRDKSIAKTLLLSTYKGAYGRKADWMDMVNKNPGTTYICGPDVDNEVCDLFNVYRTNAFKTTRGPISVRFDVATRTFSAVGDGEVVGNLVERYCPLGLKISEVASKPIRVIHQL